MTTGSPATKQPDQLDVGDVLQDRYQLREILGEGGFAVVYMAFDETIERRVAIKVLNTEQMAAEGEPAKLVRSRFLREARLAAQIRHPSIIEIYDFGVLEDIDQPYMIMEFLEGKDLDEEIDDKGALAPARLLPLFVEALEALGEAHEKDVVHKDLKPANLFLTNPGTKKETMKVVDFGIAHANHQAEERLTKTGGMTGTPHYLPPEYLEEQKVRTEMDVYQMGLILIEALSGHRVVSAETLFQIAFKHVNRELNVPPALLTGELGEVIQKAIAYYPDDRYDTAAEFAEDLAEVDPSTAPDFQAGEQLPGMEPASLAETLESGILEELPDAVGSQQVDPEAKTAISDQVQTDDVALDRTQQAFGTGEETSVTKDGTDGDSPAPPSRKTAQLPPDSSEDRADSDDNFETLSPQKVEAAFGSTWPLKVLAGLAVATLLAVGTVFALILSNGDDDEPASTNGVAVGENGDDETENGGEVAGVEGDENGEESIEEGDEEPIEEDEATPQRVVDIDSSPSGAAVTFEDGSLLGETPAELTLEEGQQRQLTVEYSGYQAEELTVGFDDVDEQPLEIALEEKADEAPVPAEDDPPRQDPPDHQPEVDEQPDVDETEEVDEEPDVDEQPDEEDEGWALPGEDEPDEEDEPDDNGFDLAQ